MAQSMIRMLVLTICICRSVQGFCEEESPTTDPHRFNEVVLEPVPETDPAAAGEDCNCQQASHSRTTGGDSRYTSRVWSEPEPWAYVSVFGGGTVTDSSRRDAMGGQYGVYGYKPLNTAVAAFGSVNLHHFEGGTQVGGTLGLFRIAVPSRHLSDRIGWSVNYDQFTDTSVGSPYVGAMRYDVHFRDESIFIPGVRYSHTITGGSIAPTVPGAATVPLSAYDLVEGYVQTAYSGTSLLLGAGYVAGINAGTYRASAQRPLSDRLTGMLQANYTDNGDWNGFFGLSYELNGSGSGSTRCLKCRRRAVRPGTIIRAQNNNTMTLGDLRNMIDNEDAFELKTAVDSLINEFGRNRLIPADVAFAIENEADAVDVARNQPSNSESDGTSSGGDSEVFAEIEDLRQALRNNPQKFGTAANQQLQDALFQQGQLQNFVNRTSGGGMSNCPPAYPFRLISGGMCFCCDNAAGTGACISCPP